MAAVLQSLAAAGIKDSVVGVEVAPGEQGWSLRFLSLLQGRVEWASWGA